MASITLIAKEEWSFWLRSKLAVTASILFLLIVASTMAVTISSVIDEREERRHHQLEAEEQFLEQPDRHPHRMVHYGHYVYRTPSPLAVFDPGLDRITGQSIFLEGHRQNSATLTAASVSADMGGLSSLTPAIAYQLFAPLLLILLGHGAITREREASTLSVMLAQGVSGLTVMLGKALALSWVCLVLMIPLAVSGLIAIWVGESVISVALMLFAYLIYLAIWVLITLIASLTTQKQNKTLTALTASWLILILLVPSLSVSNVARALPIPGSIETNFAMLQKIKSLGDGHNAADPAFKQLERQLLNEYNVDSVDQLPINFRGVVAEYSEANLTALLNEFAEQRMAAESAQRQRLNAHGWLTPILPIMDVSRTLAASDLANHHRFLREAEALRFDFVQSLNRLHAEQLSYIDDINRNDGPEGNLRARVDSENWQVLDAFSFVPASAGLRVERSASSMTILLSWFLILALIALRFSRRLSP